METLQPSDASNPAIALPIPRVAPTIAAFLPFSFKSIAEYLLYLGFAILLPLPTFARAGDGAVTAVDTLWQDHASEQATPPLFIISHSCMRPRRTAHRKEESIEPFITP